MIGDVGSVGPAPAWPAPSRQTSGRGRLRVDRVGTGSIVTEVRASSPLRLLTPSNHGHAAWIYTSTYGGGLVDGDDIALDIHVGPDAVAFLSTQASTKVYRSPRGTRGAVHAVVDPGGLLVSWPDPVVPFAGARYSQAQVVHLADGGGLVLVDVLTSGRYASGERWAFTEYRTRLEVRRAGRLLMHDATRLCASDGPLGARMGRFDAWGVVVVAGDALAAEAMRMAQEASDGVVARQGDRLVTAAAIGGAAGILRVAARSTEDVTRTIRRFLAWVPERIGDDPWRRKW